MLQNLSVATADAAAAAAAAATAAAAAAVAAAAAAPIAAAVLPLIISILFYRWFWSICFPFFHSLAKALYLVHVGCCTELQKRSGEKTT